MQTKSPRSKQSDVRTLRTPKHLAWALGTSAAELTHLLKNPGQHYKSWKAKKKSGGHRNIDAPTGRLKEIQSKLNGILACIELPTAQHGGRRHRDNVSNAAPHVDAHFLLSMDIKSFFPKVRHGMVYRCFVDLGCTPNVARLLTRIVTCKGRLPQGAPTSTTVANLVAANMVSRLTKLAKSHSATFTQYVDDITLSGPEHIKILEVLVRKIVKQEGFDIRPSKTERRGRGEVKEVTGVRVDDGMKAIEKHKVTVEEKLARLRQPSVSDFEKKKLYRSLVGHVVYISRVEPALGAKYRTELDEAMDASSSN